VKSGALFFALLFNSLLAMSEVTSSFSGRPSLQSIKTSPYTTQLLFASHRLQQTSRLANTDLALLSSALFHGWIEDGCGTFFTYWILVFATICV